MKLFESYGGMAGIEYELEAGIIGMIKPNESVMSSALFQYEIEERWPLEQYPQTDQRIPNYFRDRLLGNNWRCKYRFYMSGVMNYLFTLDERDFSVVLNTAHKKHLLNLVRNLLQKHIVGNRPPTFTLQKRGNDVVYPEQPLLDVGSFLPPDLGPTARARAIIDGSLFGNAAIGRARYGNACEFAREIISEDPGHRAHVLAYRLERAGREEAVILNKINDIMTPLVQGQERAGRVNHENTPKTIKTMLEACAFYTNYGKIKFWDAADLAQDLFRYRSQKKSIMAQVRAKHIDRSTADKILAVKRGEVGRVFEPAVL